MPNKIEMDWMSQSKIICIPNEFFSQHIFWKSNKKIILRKPKMIDSRFGNPSAEMYIHALCKIKSPLRIALMVYFNS